MLHMEPVKKKHSLPGMLLSSLITLAVLAAFFFLTRGAWNIWRNIMESWWIPTDTPYSMTDSRPISCLTSP